MDKVAETLTPTMPNNTNTEENENANKQVLLRATERDHERWKLAATKLGVSMSEFIRSNVNRAADELLDCQHPMHMRKTYPWSERCMACSHRFR